MSSIKSKVKDGKKKKEGKKDFSIDVQKINELFKKYNITNKEKPIFLKLRRECKKKKMLLNDEEIICCLICKKTFEKSLGLMKKFHSVIKEIGFGRVRLREEHIQLLKKSYFWTDPRIKGKNGEVVVLVKVSKFDMSTKEVIENEKLLTETNFFFMYNLLIGNPDAVRKGIIFVSDLRGINVGMMFNKKIWEIKRRNSPIMNKVPMRMKKYICLYPPWYVNLLMKLCKTVMSAKLFSRIVCANNADEALEYVNDLPLEFGGKFKFDCLEGVRRVLVIDEDKKLFDDVVKKSGKKEKKKDNGEEEIEGEGEN